MKNSEEDDVGRAHQPGDQRDESRCAAQAECPPHDVPPVSFGLVRPSLPRQHDRDAGDEQERAGDTIGEETPPATGHRDGPTPERREIESPVIDHHR
jgi:hypothetical protein